MSPRACSIFLLERQVNHMFKHKQGKRQAYTWQWLLNGASRARNMDNHEHISFDKLVTMTGHDRNQQG